MVLSQYQLTEEAPCEVGQIIKVGGHFFEIIQLEPMYYKFQNLSSGVDQGMTSTKYSVSDLTPSKQYIYYITGIGINGRIEIQINYQSGHPRNTPTSKSSIKLNRFQAHYLQPFTFHFITISGDTLEVDVTAEFDDVKAEIWFYGWKLKVRDLDKVPDEYIILEDIRNV